LYYLIRIHKGSKLLKVKINKIIDLLEDKENRIQPKPERAINTREEKPGIKTKIINLLKVSSGPVAFSEIAKILSNASEDCDFEYILSELEQLKNEGIIVNRMHGGKLYFQINK
jgi:hypothetical protein